MSDSNDITRLLLDWRAGDQCALAELLPLVEHRLHQIAARQMRGERPGHTLQATCLVNDAYLKLVDASVSWQNRAHFLAVAARIMRNILVDHAKARRRDKRGGDDVRVTLYEADIAVAGQEPDILDLEEALARLGAFDERKAKVIEMSFYGGMRYDEIAEALGISPATVDRELRMAKAWLYRELQDAGAHES
jgi:RNA polymerase sigma-70 factor (ECF subfamily)